MTMAEESQLSPMEQLALAGAILRLRVLDEAGAGDRKAKHRTGVLKAYRTLLSEGGQMGSLDDRGRLPVEKPQGLVDLLKHTSNHQHAASILVELATDSPWGKVQIAPEIRLATIWDVAGMFQPAIPDAAVDALERALVFA